MKHLAYLAPLTPLASRRIAALISFCLLSAGAMANTLEFAAGSGNPTGDGPTLGPVTIRFQENTDDPGGNTLVAYAGPVTATFTLMNQQFPSATDTQNGMMFGARSQGVPPAVSGELFPTMDYISSAIPSLFSSTSSTIGQGIDLTVNRAVEIFTPTYPVSQLAPQPDTSTDRIYLGDLRVRFSAPVQNPVLHLVGLGGNNSGLGFTTELELTTAGVTPAFLSGDGLVVIGNNINNSHPFLDAFTGSGAASGSVMLTGSNISQLTFKLYLRGDGGTPAWPDGGGDAFLAGFSLPPPLPVLQSIPTMSEWGLMLLSALLAAGAFFGMRDRRASPKAGS